MNLDWKATKRYRPIKYLQHCSDETWRSFDSELENAKNNDEREEIERTRQFLSAEYDDEIQRIASLKWLARAERVHLSVYDIPLADEHETHWDSGPHGTSYLSARVFRVLQKQVEDAEYERDRRKRERREIWIKYFRRSCTVAAIASIANLIVTAGTTGKK